MTRLSKPIIAGAIALAFSANVLAEECNLPNAPIIPDGNVASKDELIAAQGAYKAFDTEINDYRDCLVTQEKLVSDEAEDAEQQKAAILALDSASVDVLTKVAEEFNAAVRAFKAR